jgi:hypothetical protein
MPEDKPFSLDDIDDETLTARLRKMPAFADLFAAPAGKAAPAAPAAAAPARTSPRNTEDAMSTLVERAFAGLGHGLIDGAGKPSATPGAAAAPTAAAATPKTWREKFWGAPDEETEA